MRASPRACTTSVGTRTCGSSARTLISPNDSMMRAAISGCVVVRIRSLNQRTCSAFASGMNSDANSWRKAGFSCPQPWRISSIERLAVTPRLLAALRPAFRVAAVQHQLRHTLRMTHGVLDAGRAALRQAEQREAVEIRRGDDRLEVGDLRRRARDPARPSPTVRSRADRSGSAAGRDDRKRNQCRHTGLCQSNSRCDSQFADFTSGAPLPEVATARRTLSADLMKRIVCCMERPRATATGHGQTE